jgi:heat shock protein HtpX
VTVRPAPTTFYREVARNRRNSWILVFVVAMVLAALGAAIGYASGFGWGGVVVALIVASVMSIGSYFGGDQLVLLSSGAKEVPPDPPDQYKQLLNVVTEMSLAGGQPMPKVYTINDTAPNAFATGRDPKHASVAVTTGLLEKMDREELQGVIAHEMSHVGNYDIRFTLLVGVLVGSIALLADWFLRYTFWFGGGRRGGGSRKSEGGGGGLQVILFVVAILLAIIAPLIGRMVQLAVSRSRESLADVSAVELTRNPLALARALKTISDDPEVLEVANRATQHLYIVNPIKSFEERAKSMWDTHPPIGERIRVLENLAGQMGQLPTS